MASPCGSRFLRMGAQPRKGRSRRDLTLRPNPATGGDDPVPLRTPMPITRAAIEAAHARIAPHIRRTPVWTLPGAFGHDGPVSLKLEFLQHAGSFKTRGAFNTLLSMTVPGA